MQMPPSLLLGRFVGKVPLPLLRIQSTKVVKLKLEAAAKAAGRSFDISAHSDGLVHPRDPSETRFLGPNGMSMRPASGIMAVIIANFKSARCAVYHVPQGTPIPKELVILHEHTDHYSVQPAVSMQPKHLDEALQAFLSQPGVIKYDSKEKFYAAHPDMTPEAVGFSENA